VFDFFMWKYILRVNFICFFVPVMKIWLIVFFLWLFSLILTGCSQFNNEDKNVDSTKLTWSVETWLVLLDNIDEIKVWEEEIVSEEWITKNEEWIVGSWGATELQETVKWIIDERKEKLWDSDELTDDDIQLIEDILDELVKAVE